MTARLHAIAGPLAGATWEFTDRDLALGRDADCDVVVPDHGVSRRHCVVRREADNFVIEDLGSRNGLFVAGERVSGATLPDGGRFAIGASLFQVVAPGSSPPEITVEMVEGSPASTHESPAIEPALLAAQQSGERRTGALIALRDAALALAAAGDLSTAALDLARRAALACGADRGSVVLVRGAGPTVELGPAFGWRPSSDGMAPALVSRTLVARALETGTAMVAADTATCPALSAVASLGGDGPRAIAAAPMMLGDRPVGVLCVDARPGALGPRELEIAAGLAAIAAAPLELLRRGEEREAEDVASAGGSGGAVLLLEPDRALDIGAILRLRTALARVRGSLAVVVLDSHPWDGVPPRILDALAALDVPRDARLAVKSAAPSLARLATLAATRGAPGSAQQDAAAWVRRLLAASVIVAARAAHALDDGASPDESAEAVGAARRLAQRIDKATPGTCPAAVLALPELPPFPGLDGGETDRGRLLLDDDPAAIAKKVKSARTDARPALDPAAEMSPGVRGLLLLLAELRGERVDAVLRRHAGASYGVLKQDVAAAAADWHAAFRARRDALAASDLPQRLAAGNAWLERGARDMADAYARATRGR